LISFNNSTKKTPIRRSGFADLYTRCTIDYFVSRGSIFLSSFNSRTPKTLLGARILVIFPMQVACLVSNFVAMATGTGRGGICLTSFNSQNTKYPW